MRVILLTEEWPYYNSGGVGILVYDQSEAYHNMGFNVFVLVKYKAFSKISPPTDNIKIYFYSSFSEAKSLLESIIDNKTLIHNHTQNNYSLLNYIANKGVKIIHSLHGYAPFYIEEMKKYYLPIPNWYENEIINDDSFLRNIDKRVLITVPSQYLYNAIVNKSFNKKYILLSAYNNKRFQCTDNQKNNGSFTIGYAGRLSPEKGIDIFNRLINMIIKEVPDININICGSLSKDKNLVEWKTNFQWWKSNNRILFYDNKFNEMDNFYKKIDVLISPSFIDAAPLVVSEALASGCFVISSNLGGAKEVASNHPKAFIVDNNVEIDYFRLIHLIRTQNKVTQNKACAIQWCNENTWENRLQEMLERI